MIGAELLATSQLEQAPSHGSSFLQRQLEAAGCHEIVALAKARNPLTEQQARSLLKLPFPLLGAIIEESGWALRKHQIKTRRDIPLRFVGVLPLTDICRELRLTRASLTADTADAELRLGEAMLKLVETMLKSHTTNSALVLQLDSWEPISSFPELLNLLPRVMAKTSRKTEIHGPSTSELKSILDQHSSAESELLGQLTDPLFTGIEGGGDIAIYQRAADSGVPVHFGQNMLKSRLIEQTSGSENSFLANLFAIRKTLLPSESLRSWFPWSNVLLDRSQPKEAAPLGLEIARAIAIARLVLPEVPLVRAPISLLGAKLAHIALYCGAQDLGYIALDMTAAEQSGLLRLQDIVGEFLVDEMEML